MKDFAVPDRRRDRSPVRSYAVLLGIIAVAAILFSTTFGRSRQNPHAAPTTAAEARSSPR